MINYIVSYLKTRTFLGIFSKSRAECGIWHIVGPQYKLVENISKCQKKNGVILNIVRGGFQKRWSLSQAPKTWLFVIPLFIHLMYLTNTFFCHCILEVREAHV